MQTHFLPLYTLCVLMLSCHPNTTHLGLREDKDWDLLHAASEGDLQKAERALQEGADIATKGEQEGNDAAYTPLHYACEKNHKKVVKYLLERQVDANAVTARGRTPLHCACMAGHLEMVQLLKEHGVDMNQKDKIGGTPMHYAAAAGCLAIIQYLEKDISIGVETNDKSTPIHIAAAQGRLEVVKYLYEKDMGCLQHKNQWGMTPLHYAVFGKQEEVVKFLSQVDNVSSFINLQTNEGSTALHLAVSKGDEKSVRALVEAGVNTRITNNQRVTPLAIAEKKGPPKIALMLLAAQSSHSAETATTSCKRRNPMRKCRRGSAQETSATG